MSEPPSPDAPPARIGLHPAWFLFALVVLIFPMAELLRQGADPPPLLGPAPRFSLLDQQGATFESKELAGSVSIFNFVFTRCPDVCPMLSTRAAWVSEELASGPALRQPVRVVSVTVDPDYDTPTVLQHYAQRYGADPSRWSFLTGPRDSIDRVVAGFQQGLERAETGGETPSIVHSERFVLVDANGIMRGYYRSDDEGLSELIADTRSLARRWF